MKKLILLIGGLLLVSLPFITLVGFGGEPALLVALIVIPVGDTIATSFFFYLFMRSKRDPAPKPGSSVKEVANRPRLWGGPVFLKGRSWLLGLMTASWAVITMVFILIGFLSARRLLGLEPLAQGVFLTVFGFLMLGLIPIMFAVAFYLTRRKRGGPPPFGEED